MKKRSKAAQAAYDETIRTHPKGGGLLGMTARLMCAEFAMNEVNRKKEEEEMKVVVPFIDPLTLDSIFPKPGRNDTCHCGSGAKYKRCHETADQKAWRVVAQLRKEAENVGATLPRFNRPELEP